MYVFLINIFILSVIIMLLFDHEYKLHPSRQFVSVGHNK